MAEASHLVNGRLRICYWNLVVFGFSNVARTENENARERQ